MADALHIGVGHGGPSGPGAAARMNSETAHERKMMAAGSPAGFPTGPAFLGVADAV